MTALELTLSKTAEQGKPPSRRSLTLAAKQNILFLIRRIFWWRAQIRNRKV